MRDVVLDLLTGSTCVGCARPGRMLCAVCWRLLAGGPRVAWPQPTPPGLVTPWASADYEGAVRSMINGHKDSGQFGFRGALADLLIEALRPAVLGLKGPFVLVPVPSRPGSGRRRGYDPMGAIVRLAVARLRREGRPAWTAPLLVSSRSVVDQTGLSASQRSANLAGSMSCPSARLARLASRARQAHVVVCDDVLTTGATAAEAQRALTAVGLPPVGIAVIAATRRRICLQSGGSLLPGGPRD